MVATGLPGSYCVGKQATMPDLVHKVQRQREQPCLRDGWLHTRFRGLELMCLMLAIDKPLKRLTWRPSAIPLVSHYFALQSPFFLRYKMPGYDRPGWRCAIVSTSHVLFTDNIQISSVFTRRIFSIPLRRCPDTAPKPISMWRYLHEKT